METVGGDLLDKQVQYTVAAVDRALEILNLLGKSSRELGVTELAKVLGVQKSTVHSLMQTMLARDFVQQTETGRYALGVKLLQLGELFAQRLDIRSVAKPVLTELADETGKVALLAVLSRHELIIIDKVEPERPFLIIPKFDFSLAFHSTAVGKVLLAFAAEETRDAILRKELSPFTPFTITDVDEIQLELSKVRLDTYAIGCDETIEGVTCFAVPIYNAANQVVAALSVSSASSLINLNGYHPIIATLKQKAAIISQRLGQPGKS